VLDNDQKGVQSMSRILHAVRCRPWAIVAVLAAALLSVGAVSAGAASETGAASEIEGVWSFEHGQVDIVPIAGGKFEGIVTVATTFANCPHKEGEHMWTAMTPQSDGSYWGLHQWFHADCSANTTLGPTAWRVLHEPNGSRSLRVCFSDPGTAQPTIAPDGAPKEASEYAEHHVTYGCVSSTPTAPLPVVSGTSGSSGNAGSGSASPGETGPVESLTLPSAKQCLRVGLFKIRLKEPQYDPFKQVTITFKGHKLATSHKGDYIVATLNLRKLSKGTFTLVIHATTVLGHHLSASPTYHLCKKIKPPKKRHRR
jgi:hypothetical protein